MFQKFFYPNTATKISSATAFFLMIFKFVIGFFSGSLAVLASAIDSFLDFLISLVNFFTLRESQKPPDQNHPFGHGKFEAFAEMLQGIVIGISGIIIGFYGIQKIITPIAVEYETIALGVMIIALGITILLYFYLKSVAQKSKSLVIKADSEHYYVDILSNSAVIVSLLLSSIFDVLWIDGVVSLGIAIFILHSAFELLQESFFILSDREISPEKKAKIIQILKRYEKEKNINGWHDLRTRFSGNSFYITIHLEFPPDQSLLYAHIISEKIEKDIYACFPKSDILMHFDTHKDQDIEY